MKVEGKQNVFENGVYCDFSNDEYIQHWIARILYILHNILWLRKLDTVLSQGD